MRPHARLLTAALIACLAAGAFGPTPPARAESRDAATITLGWQTENADAVLVGTVTRDVRDAVSGERTIDLCVDRTLHGTPVPGSTIRVTCSDHGTAAATGDAVQVLAFLRRTDTSVAPGNWAPLSGAFSVRPLPAGSAEARFPALVASLHRAIESKDPAAVRALLVTWMEDGDPGVAWSGAMDFVRHEELHAGLTEVEGTRIVAAFARQPIGKNTKDALAFAAAATRTPAAVQALVDSLLLDGAARIRSTVAEALRRIASPDAERLAVAALRGATPDQQESLLVALAAIGGAGAAAEVRPLLEATDARVRTAAAAALGALARSARVKDPTARLGVADALSTHILEAEATAGTVPEREFRARLWALAQLDEPAAFDTLRRASVAPALPETLRAYAARLIARPRQSLVL